MKRRRGVVATMADDGLGWDLIAGQVTYSGAQRRNYIDAWRMWKW